MLFSIKNIQYITVQYVLYNQSFCFQIHVPIKIKHQLIFRVSVSSLNGSLTKKKTKVKILGEMEELGKDGVIGRGTPPLI